LLFLIFLFKNRFCFCLYSPDALSAAKVQKITRKAIPLNAMIDEFYCFLMNFTHSNLLISITFAEENANNL